MLLTRIPRRRRWTRLKFLLLAIAVSGVMFWFSQVWNVSINESDARANQVRSHDSQNIPKKHEILATDRQRQIDDVKKVKSFDDLRLNQIAAPDVLSDNHPVAQKKLIPFIDETMKVTPGLGENGEPVFLSSDEQKLADEDFSSAAFNVYLSDRIALNRSVPDSRHHLCKYERYDYNLPSASVIIIFTEEAWSALLRTIHSVINRSPKHLLKEIILVDDFSKRDYLQTDLKPYIDQTFPPGLVKLIRLKSRKGLIRARLAGASLATGDVLVFLDSHCETNEKWLEPLLQRIKEDRKAVLCPIIDVIDDKTLQYFATNLDYFQVGGFTWSGHFTWIEISPQEKKRRKSSISSTRSPTMAGGLFAIDRQYFEDIGSYDAGMDIWGGENLEMSFRVWLCGGTLEIIPCSHVGHIFRSYHPYTFPGNKDTHGINTVRTVEVWMDDYKKYFYDFRRDLLTVDYGDISERLKLKKKLQCKPFSWYLNNIIPEKFTYDVNVYGYGMVRNPISNLCLDVLNRDESSSEPLGLYYCNKQEDVVMNQMFSLSNTGELRREENCAEITGEESQSWLPVVMSKCHGKKGDQEWVHKKGGIIVHKQTGKCLNTVRRSSEDDVIASTCDGSFTQIWWFQYYTDIELDMRPKV